MVQVDVGVGPAGISDPRHWGSYCNTFLLQLEAWFDQSPLSVGIGIPLTYGIHPTTFHPNCGVVTHFLVCLTLGMHREFEADLSTKSKELGLPVSPACC